MSQRPNAWRHTYVGFVKPSVFLAPSLTNGRQKYDFACLLKTGHHTFMDGSNSEDAQRIRAAAFRYRQSHPDYFLKIETYSDGVAIWRISGGTDATI